MITEFGKFGPFQHALQPMEHQAKIFNETRNAEYYALLWEMGVGKTKPAIDTAAWLFLKGEIDGVLVISDKGAYANWTDTEIPLHMPKNIPYRQLQWKSTVTNKATHKAIAEMLNPQDDLLDIVAMNTEAFSHKKALAYAIEFLETHYAMIIVDESDSIKRLESKRTETILKLRDFAPYRRILTGTPISNSPLDIYAQAEFLKQGLLGDSFTVFRAQYAIIMLEKGYGFKPHYKILGYKNLEMLKEKIKPWSSRLTKDEALDLPPKIYERWQVEHTPEQERMYKELKETALTQYSAGMITAVSAMTMMMKLHQINCGHVKLNPTDDEEEGQTVDIPSNRVTELLNVLSKVNGKVIIWACFQRDFDLIGEALTKEYGRDSWVDYHGRTSQTQRPANLDLFIKNDKTRFFLSNPATGGRSITLTVASYAIYYSYNWRLALRLQSEDRDHRKGQTKSCTYVDLCIPKTIDVKILASHKRKKDLASMILDNFGVLLNDETEEIEAT